MPNLFTYIGPASLCLLGLLSSSASAQSGCAGGGAGEITFYAVPGLSAGSLRVGLQAGLSRAGGRAALLLENSAGPVLPPGLCLPGLRGRLGPAVQLDSMGRTTWQLPAPPPGTSFTLRALAWAPAAPWRAGSVSAALHLPLRAGPPVQDHLVGAVVITEFMKDAGAVHDAFGEWIELFNVSTKAIDLEGWVLSDDGIDLTSLDNQGAGIVIQPGARLVLGRDDDPSRNGGVHVDHVYMGFTLSNSSDEITLSTPSGTVVDRIAYDDGIDWPDATGRSVSLDPAILDAEDNDWGFNWCLSSSPLPGGDKGTPGATNDTCGG